MKRVLLGHTDIQVSQLCFGTLTMGPLQRNMSVHAGSKLIEMAAEMGICFFDTAEIYGTYAHIAPALKKHPNLVIATKCYAYDADGAKKSVELARKALNRDFIDIFLLHEQESEHTLRGHQEALDYFLLMKQKGIIRAVGLSTHHIAAVNAAAKVPEIDVIHPILNMKGIGIADGTRLEMENAIAHAHQAGKGVYAMKSLGGGHLISSRKDAFSYICKLPYVDAIAVGMQHADEILYNVSLFENGTADENVAVYRRELMIHEWCNGCGACVQRCPNHALRVEHGSARVDMAKCILCGYCSTACPNFCIKVI